MLGSLTSVTVAPARPPLLLLGCGSSRSDTGGRRRLDNYGGGGRHVRSKTPKRRRRVLIFTIPNAGHLNVLKRMITQYRDEYEFRLVLVDRTNTPPDLADVGVPVVTPVACGRFTNTAAGEVFARANGLLDECVALA